MNTIFLLVAHAQVKAPAPIVTLSGVRNEILCKLADWTFTFAIIFSILFTLYAAFTYLTSGGNEEQVGKATRALQYIAIGIAVAIIAAGVPSIVGSLIGERGTIGNVCSRGGE